MPKYKSRDSIDLMVMVKFKLFKSEQKCPLGAAKEVY
jgi:hypothetical protein